MSDNTVNEQTETPATTTNDEATVAMIDKGDVVIKLDSITEGQWKGFKFYFSEVKGVEEAIRHFTAQSQDGKDGSKVITGLLNSALKSRMRSRANSLLTPRQKKDDEKEVDYKAYKKAFIAEKLALLGTDGGDILVSEEDAFTYVPGEREVDSISGLIRQQTNLKKAVLELGESIKKAKTEGNEEVAVKLTTEARTQYAKLKEVSEEITKRQSSDLDNLKAEFGIE